MAFDYEHQRNILSEDPLITGFWLGTGSGKTRIALKLAQKKTLVICPKTQKEDQNWERENWNNKFAKNITVVSKEWFRAHWQELSRFETVIVDEAHTCLGVTPNTRQRNKVKIPKTSQLYEALYAFVEKTKPTRLYLCTATIMRSPMTVWGASQVLGYRDIEGKAWDFFAFRERFYVRLNIPGREIWVPKTDSPTKDLLASLVRKLGYVGRLEDFFDVPPQTYKTIHIELTAKQKQRIKDMRLEYPEPIVRVGKIHQIENGTLAGDEFSKAETFDNGKIEALLDISIEYPRVVVFAKYTAQIELIASEMRKAKKKVLTMTGATKDRGSVIKEANEAKECIFVVQAQISAGWELPEYPCMVFASRTYSFVDYDQALGRIQRANNIKKNLYIHLVVKGGVDEAVHRCLESKKDFNERLFIE